MSDSAINSEIDVDVATISLIEDNIIVIKLKEGAEIELSHVKLMKDKTNELVGKNNEYYILIDGVNNAQTSKEAREWGSTEEAQSGLRAQAFLVKSVASKLVGNFIVQFYKPPAKTKLFDNKDAALDWLREQKAK